MIENNKSITRIVGIEIEFNDHKTSSLLLRMKISSIKYQQPKPNPETRGPKIHGHHKKQTTV